MPLTPSQQRHVDYFRKSVKLQAPDVEQDPAYVYTDDDIWDILNVVVPFFNKDYADIEDVPNEFLYVIMLLARKELYHRLAAATAPLYPLEAEGAKLERNVRFDHYLDLIKQLEEEYQNIFDNLKSTGGLTLEDLLRGVQTFEVTTASKHMSRRNYNLQAAIVPVLAVDNIGTDYVELSWGKYLAGKFSHYAVYITTEPLVDPYAEHTSFPATPSLRVNDPHRVRGRVRGLTPATDYTATLVVYDLNGRHGYVEQIFRTEG